MAGQIGLGTLWFAGFVSLQGAPGPRLKVEAGHLSKMSLHESKGYEEEESESEAETDDAECEEPAGILCACATFCMSQVPRRS